MKILVVEFSQKIEYRETVYDAGPDGETVSIEEVFRLLNHVSGYRNVDPASIRISLKDA